MLSVSSVVELRFVTFFKIFFLLLADLTTSLAPLLSERRKFFIAKIENRKSKKEI